jgi:hypothetical protein
MKQSLIKHRVIIRWLFLLIAVLLASCTTMPANDNPINALAEQYKQLRARQKALPAGVFDKELNGSGGKLETVLAELGKQLGKPDYSQEDIIRLMGQPDEIMTAGDYQPATLGRDEHAGIIPTHETRLVYYWRGGHDYLYFISKDGIIQSAHWYAAGE